MTPAKATSAIDIPGYASLACEAARVSEDLLRAGFANATIARMGGEDVKLAEDSKSEALIIDVLASRSPFPILSEERGWTGGESQPGCPYWVVDPLDGSYNYLLGLPLFAVAIALCIDDSAILGCVNDVARGDVYIGGAGIGLRRNGICRDLPRTERTGGILATGFPVARQGSKAGIDSQGVPFLKVRMLGSAALSLAWVADGRMDGYSERGIYWWDVAAGLALVEAAGGSSKVATHDPNDKFSPVAPLNVVATRQS
ncbi:myo-inositol-1(or 4)-monophosphatase [Sphingobium xanthum]|jgi:myo-inositol-1(or 4)-monophosphatase|uniref:inositol monophosphatase family protein n=1 Tax=Sphingobium xanthum TaxID=1387165 RepID=UPI001C8CB47C|nr:inositol monophosphatase family protein [Sphingobium xanthum]